MKPEELFGVNVGKGWNVLKSNGRWNIQSITKTTQLKETDVFGALGWLGREGKIQIVEDKKGRLFKLV